ncbi:hypothetical protein ACOSP7_022464 [Xanthoceras sorbifolium]
MTSPTARLLSSRPHPLLLVDLADWEEECECLIRMASHELAVPALHLLDELAFDAVDVAQWPTVDQRLQQALESFVNMQATPLLTVLYRQMFYQMQMLNNQFM